jgi:hypothetical protein
MKFTLTFMVGLIPPLNTNILLLEILEKVVSNLYRRYLRDVTPTVKTVVWLSLGKK